LTPATDGVGGNWTERVVIALQDSAIRGYLEGVPWETKEGVLLQAPEGLPEFIHVRREDTNTIERIETRFAKAVFFVDRFDGDAEHKDLRFSTGSPIKHGIWIRVQFLDGEVMEGIVKNTIHYLANPGFFLRPTDPETNNRLVYLMKSQLKDHRVLGLRDL
jgi:hypothetical protein